MKLYAPLCIFNNCKMEKPNVLEIKSFCHLFRLSETKTIEWRLPFTSSFNLLLAERLCNKLCFSPTRKAKLFNFPSIPDKHIFFYSTEM